MPKKDYFFIYLQDLKKKTKVIQCGSILFNTAVPQKPPYLDFSKKI